MSRALMATIGWILSGHSLFQTPGGGRWERLGV